MVHNCKASNELIDYTVGLHQKVCPAGRNPASDIHNRANME